MMYESQEKKTTALLPSVGADGGQPSQNFTNQSIPENACQNNCQIVNSQNNFPTDIVQNGRFCCWRYEERDGRKTKVPYNPLTGQMARSNDASSFVDFATVKSAIGYDGIGIGIFNGICAIDLDDCVTDSGYYSGAASEIVSLMHSYTEYSPSGNGLHILFRADGFQYDTKRYYIMNHKAGLEVYVAGATKKYVTLTGNVCESYEFGDRTKELQILLNRFMRRFETDAGNAINAVNSDFGDDELLNLAKRSKNGAAFTALFSGSQTGYSSQSEADMALCQHLAFWTGKDAQKIDTLFRKSGLMRDKWDRPQSGSTYGAITIQKAIENCRDVYSPKHEKATDETPQFEPIVPLMPQWSSLPQFPIEALPEVMKNYVRAVAAHSQTSPDMAAVIGLGVLAVCLQGKFKVEGTPGYYEPLSLYTVLIAAPGERKSGVMRAMTSVLYDYEQEFNKSYQRLHGEDVITTPKTRKSNRTIRMPDFLCNEMQDYLGMLYGVDKNDRIFNISKHYLGREMERGSKAAGVKRIRIHDLRHSHISLLIDMGFSAVAIADRVGHESIEITYRYAHLFPSKQDEMARKLGYERKEIEDVR